MEGREQVLRQPEPTSTNNDLPRLSEVVDAPLLQSMMDDFYAVTRIPMSLIDLQGTVVVGAGWQDACMRFHRVNPESCAHCLASDTILTASISPGEVKLYKCHNGMWDAATPILVGDRRMGNLFTGQFFFDDEPVDLEFFQAQAHRYGYDQTAYLAAIAAAPRLSRDTVQTGLRFLASLSGMISRLSVSNLDRARNEVDLRAAMEAQAELASRMAENREVLQTIINNTETALAYLDAEFRFVAVNTAYGLGSGYDPDELIGKNHFDLFPNAENEAIFQDARRTGEAVEYRARPFRFQEQPWRAITYWDWRLTPVRHRGGRVSGFVLSTQDVTRRIRQQAYSDALNRLNDVAHADLDFGGILAQAAPDLAEAAGCEVAAIVLREPDGVWHVEEAYGLSDECRLATLADAQVPEAIEAARSGGSALFRASDSGCGASRLARALGLQSMVLTPLAASGHSLGAFILGFTSGPGEFDEHAVDFAVKVSSSLSMALNNARLFHDATRSARLSDTLAKVNEILLSALTVNDVVGRLVNDVSRVAGADMSLVIEVDGDRYTVTHVRNVPKSLVGQTRPATFYPGFALAASGRRPVLIDDTWQDPRTNKEFVVPNGLRAFQLLPLIVDGVVTGVLALAYDRPRHFTREDNEAADRMATAMSAALGNARLYENEHRIADRLQDALLDLPAEVPGIEFAHSYHSAADAARVGGDFYDIFELADNVIGFTIGDVAGKGLNAAVLTSLAKNTIRAHAGERSKSPAAILMLTNDVVFRATPAEAFVTVLFGTLDCLSGKVTYASAGHPPPVILRADGGLALLPATGPLLGAFPGATFRDAESRLHAGDLLLLYTDGVTEARGPDGFFGEERLRNLLSTAPRDTAASLLDRVLTSVLGFGGGKLSDDLAALVLKRTLREQPTPEYEEDYRP